MKDSNKVMKDSNKVMKDSNKVMKDSNKKRLEKLEEKIRNIDTLPSAVIFYDSELTLPDLSLDCNRGLIFLSYKEKSEMN